MLLLSTSPGPRGAATVMANAQATFSRTGADIKASFSLPSFYDHFDTESGVTHPDLAASLSQAIAAFAG